MKKNYFVYVFISILLAYFFYYGYHVIVNLINGNINIEDTNNILLFDTIQKIDSTIDGDSGSEFKIYNTDYNENIAIYQEGDNLIELTDTYDYSSIKYIISFGKELKKINKDLLYIEVPEKAFFYQEYLNKYSYYFGYDKYNDSLRLLDKNNIKYVDPYKTMSNSNINRDQLFYKTDSHWTLKTGLYFSNVLIDNINDNFDLDINKKNIEENKFKTKTIKRRYNGAYTIYKNSTVRDDFTYYFPNYDTNFTVYSEKDKVEGDIKEVIYNYNNGDKTYYNKIIGGTQSLVKIINNKIDNDKKILIIGNSFSKALTPFLSLSVKELDIIDIRFNVGNYNGSVLKYIKKSNPDLVIFLAEVSSDADYEKLIN